jgi:transcriptional regulator
MTDKREKKSRKAITLDSNIKMIKLSDEGVSQAELGRRLSFSRTTVNTVIKNKQQIRAEVKSATPVNTTIIRKRDSPLLQIYFNKFWFLHFTVSGY